MDRIFLCTDALSHYMSGKGRQTIAVEVASSDRSDFEVTELYVRLPRENFARYLIEKKGYREEVLLAEEVRAPVGRVLLPPYRLVMEEEIRFDLKNILFYHRIVMDGIRL